MLSKARFILQWYPTRVHRRLTVVICHLHWEISVIQRGRYYTIYSRGGVRIFVCRNVPSNKPFVHLPDDRWMSMEHLWDGNWQGKLECFGGKSISCRLVQHVQRWNGCGWNVLAVHFLAEFFTILVYNPCKYYYWATQKFPAVNITRMFIYIFTRAHHWSLYRYLTDHYFNLVRA